MTNDLIDPHVEYEVNAYIKLHDAEIHYQLSLAFCYCIDYIYIPTLKN